MTSPELENLVRTGKLKREPPATGEIEGLRRSGEARLADAPRPELSIESRFDLAYNAAHVLSLAARTAQTAATSCFRRCRILWGSRLLSGECWPRAMKGGISRNMRGCSKWTNASSLI
jgi:hypothetical protein